MSKKKTSNKGGRPSKFDTVDLKQVEILTKAGWTDVQMAEFFGVCKKTWDNWKAKNAEFLHTLKDWKAEADHKVERSLYERACGYETTEERIVGTGEDARVLESTKQWPPDTTAIIFWLKNRNRAEWRDKQDHELTGKDGAPLQQQTVVVLPAKDAEN